VTSTLASGDSARLGRFVAGDPLRGLAALMVFVVHAEFEFAFVAPGLTGIFGDLGERFLTGLAVCVYVFFVLSGYLIARPFVRAYVEGTDMPRVRPYLLNRALRILPAYWVVLTVTLAIDGSLGSSATGVAATYGLLQELFLTPARGLLLQSWTISVEAGFYLLVPAAAFGLVWLTNGLGRRGRLAVVGAALLAAWAASVAFRHSIPATIGPFDKLQLATPAFLWSFLPGIALAALEAGGAETWARRPEARLLPTALLAISAISFVAVVLIGGHPVLQRTVTVAVLGTAMAGALVAAPLVQQWSGRPCWRGLDNAPLRWVGVRSYSLYLIHLGILRSLKDPALDLVSPLGAFFLLLAIGLPISLVLAHLSYEFVERPFLRRRLPWRQSARRTQASATAVAQGRSAPDVPR
jgi:acetyltransferase